MKSTDKKSEKNERHEKLLDLVGDKLEGQQLVEEMLFLEGQLAELRKFPMIKVNPNNPSQAKPTATAKLYKELLQQYINLVKAVEKLTSEEEESSPLREYLQTLRADAE